MAKQLSEIKVIIEYEDTDFKAQIPLHKFLKELRLDREKLEKVIRKIIKTQ